MSMSYVLLVEHNANDVVKLNLPELSQEQN